MTSDPAVYGPIAGILAMALATYFTRVAGFWLMAHVPMTARVRRMLETLPGAIVVANSTLSAFARATRSCWLSRGRRPSGPSSPWISSSAESGPCL